MVMTNPPSSALNSPPVSLEQLATRAMIGADRAGGGSSTAAAVLNEASIHGLRARAGRTALPAVANITPCPPDPRDEAPLAALITLRRLLDASDTKLIEEWGDLASRVSVRISDGLLPPLMDWWSRQPRKSAAIGAAIGPRGVWLSTLNPQWSTAAAEVGAATADEGIWETGNETQRTHLLTAVRVASPPRGLELVRATWSSDGASERARFVAALQAGLCASDEPFLEQCLDDRSKQVRAAAADLLTRLPASALRARMVQRAAAMFAVEQGKKGLLRKSVTTLTLDAPKEFDPSWARDGVEEKPAGNQGKRAWWLQQLFAACDPHDLARQLNAEPEPIFKAIEESDYQRAAREGLLEAAGRCSDPEWVTAIITHAIDSKHGQMEQAFTALRALNPVDREKAAIRLFVLDAIEWLGRWHLLMVLDHAWSAEFSALVMKRLGADLPKKAVNWYDLQAVADHVAMTMHPTSAADFEAVILAAMKDDPTPGIRKAIDRAHLRATMQKEFGL